MFSLVRDVFGSFVKADNKACTRYGFCAKYERPAHEQRQEECYTQKTGKYNYLFCLLAWFEFINCCILYVLFKLKEKTTEKAAVKLLCWLVLK